MNSRARVVFSCFAVFLVVAGIAAVRAVPDFAGTTEMSTESSPPVTEEEDSSRLPQDLGRLPNGSRLTLDYEVTTRAAPSSDSAMQATQWRFTTDADWLVWQLQELSDGEPAGYCQYQDGTGIYMSMSGCEDGRRMGDGPAVPSPHLNPDAYELALSTSGDGFEPTATDQSLSPSVMEGDGSTAADEERTTSFETRTAVECDVDAGYDCEGLGVRGGSSTDLEVFVFDDETGLLLAWERSVGDVVISSHEVTSYRID